MLTKICQHTFYGTKKLGGLRPIINLRALNKFMPKETYTMEGLQYLKLLLHCGYYLAKIDLTDAYLAIPIAEKSRNYLAFAFARRMYLIRRPGGKPLTKRTDVSFQSATLWIKYCSRVLCNNFQANSSIFTLYVNQSYHLVG